MRLSVTPNTARPLLGEWGMGGIPHSNRDAPGASEHRSGARSAGECSVSLKAAVKRLGLFSGETIPATAS
jgi:hypothetical protein